MVLNPVVKNIFGEEYPSKAKKLDNKVGKSKISHLDENIENGAFITKMTNLGREIQQLGVAGRKTC